MLETGNCVLVLVDVQEKLFALMDDKDALLKNLATLVSGLKIMEIPVIWVEQIPDKMGPSIPEIRDLLQDSLEPVVKSSFSCYPEESFGRQLLNIGRKQVLIAGIETHVCVYQTTADLLKHGYHVEVIEDCTSSRTKTNRSVGLRKISDSGAQLTSVETVLFELMKDSSHPAFRQILKIVK